MGARTIYAVTYGEYSDWGVECLFENRSDAEAHAKLYEREGDPAGERVWEYTLYDSALEYTDIFRVSALVHRDGRIERRNLTRDSTYQPQPPRPVVRVVRWGREDWPQFVKVHGPDEAAVLKVLTERTMGLKAIATFASR